MKVSTEDKANFFIMTNMSTAGSKKGEFQSQTRSVCPFIHPSIYPPS